MTIKIKSTTPTLNIQLRCTFCVGREKFYAIKLFDPPAPNSANVVFKLTKNFKEHQHENQLTEVRSSDRPKFNAFNYF